MLTVPESSVVSPLESTYAGYLKPEERAQVLQIIADASGMRLPDLLTGRKIGDALIPYGEERLRELKVSIDRLPDVLPGFAALRASVLAEKRKDVKVPIQQVRMDPTEGEFVGPAGKAVGYTRTGFGHVLGYVKPSTVRNGFKDTLLALPPRIRADAFNHFAEHATRQGDPVMLRTMVNPGTGKRFIRAVTTESHSLEHGDDLAIADAVQAALPAGGKLRITRGLDRTDLEILWPGMSREIKVGDAVLFGLSISNSETKGASLKVSPKILRVLCYNFTTAYASGQEEEITLRHVGDLRVKLGPAIRRALNIIDPFVKAFGDAYRSNLPAFAPTRGEVLNRVGKVFGLPSSTLDLAGQLWDADGVKTAGDTLAGLSNALTRASQKQGMEAAAETERVAGRVIVEGWSALD